MKYESKRPASVGSCGEAMTYSAHWIRHAGLAAAIADHCAREAAAMPADLAHMATFGPYRAAGASDDE
jgi:predicted N-acyltransferase